MRNNPLALTDPTGMDACSQYATNGSTPNAGSYTQCEAEANMYNGGDLAYPTCSVDGAQVDCALVASSQAAVQCPNNQCSGVGQNGNFFVFTAGTGSASSGYWVHSTTQVQSGLVGAPSDDSGDLTGYWDFVAVAPSVNNFPMMQMSAFDDIFFKGRGPRKGERKTAAKPSGTPNPGKHVRPSKTHPGQWEVKNPLTGTWVIKPPGWTPTQGMIVEGVIGVGATVTAASILEDILAGVGVALAFP